MKHPPLSPSHAMTYAKRAVLLALLAVPLFAVSAMAHAVGFPATAEPGAYQKYVLRVPNERDVPTTRVKLRIPPEVLVISFAEVEGWSLETEIDPDGRIVVATWTGELPVGRFVEFPFIAVNPEEPARVRWDAVQTYAGGVRVAWDGPEGSPAPASFTEIRAGVGPWPLSTWLAGAALAVALLALGLMLRRPEAP